MPTSQALRPPPGAQSSRVVTAEPEALQRSVTALFETLQRCEQERRRLEEFRVKNKGDASAWAIDAMAASASATQAAWLAAGPALEAWIGRRLLDIRAADEGLAKRQEKIAGLEAGLTRLSAELAQQLNQVHQAKAGLSETQEKLDARLRAVEADRQRVEIGLGEHVARLNKLEAALAGRIKRFEQQSAASLAGSDKHLAQMMLEAQGKLEGIRVPIEKWLGERLKSYEQLAEQRIAGIQEALMARLRDTERSARDAAEVAEAQAERSVQSACEKSRQTILAIEARLQQLQEQAGQADKSVKERLQQTQASLDEALEETVKAQRMKIARRAAELRAQAQAVIGPAQEVLDHWIAQAGTAAPEALEGIIASMRQRLDGATEACRGQAEQDARAQAAAAAEQVRLGLRDKLARLQESLVPAADAMADTARQLLADRLKTLEADTDARRQEIERRCVQARAVLQNTLADTASQAAALEAQTQAAREEGIRVIARLQAQIRTATDEAAEALRQRWEQTRESMTQTVDHAAQDAQRRAETLAEGFVTRMEEQISTLEGRAVDSVIAPVQERLDRWLAQAKAAAPEAMEALLASMREHLSAAAEADRARMEQDAKTQAAAIAEQAGQALHDQFARLRETVAPAAAAMTETARQMLAESLKALEADADARRQEIENRCAQAQAVLQSTLSDTASQAAAIDAQTLVIREEGVRVMARLQAEARAVAEQAAGDLRRRWEQAKEALAQDIDAAAQDAQQRAGAVAAALVTRMEAQIGALQSRAADDLIVPVREGLDRWLAQAKAAAPGAVEAIAASMRRRLDSAMESDRKRIEQDAAAHAAAVAERARQGLGEQLAKLQETLAPAADAMTDTARQMLADRLKALELDADARRQEIGRRCVQARAVLQATLSDTAAQAAALEAQTQAVREEGVRVIARLQVETRTAADEAADALRQRWEQMKEALTRGVESASQDAQQRAGQVAAGVEMQAAQTLRQAQADADTALVQLRQDVPRSADAAVAQARARLVESAEQLRLEAVAAGESAEQLLRRHGEHLRDALPGAAEGFEQALTAQLAVFQTRARESMASCERQIRAQMESLELDAGALQEHLGAMLDELDEKARRNFEDAQAAAGEAELTARDRMTKVADHLRDQAQRMAADLTTLEDRAASAPPIEPAPAGAPAQAQSPASDEPRQALEVKITPAGAGGALNDAPSAVAAEPPKPDLTARGHELKRKAQGLRDQVRHMDGDAKPADDRKHDAA